MSPSPDQDFVLKTIKSRDVHFVRFWFCDVLGHMKSFAVIPSELENAFEEGMGFDGSCIRVLSAMLLGVCSAPLKRPRAIFSMAIPETC